MHTPQLTNLTVVMQSFADFVKTLTSAVDMKLHQNPSEITTQVGYVI